jgi:hypothetical protein
MRLEPLYRVRFSYPEHYDVSAPDVGGLFFAEGRCEGTLAGRLRGMNTRACARTTSICPTSKA